MMVPLLTWAQWLTSPGFGGLAAVVAAVLALIGVSRASAVQRANARKDQWWDRLKWAVDLVLSGDEAKANAGLAALAAITEAHGFDPDEINFVKRMAGLFIEPDDLVNEPREASADGPAGDESGHFREPDGGGILEEVETSEENVDGSDRN